MLPTNLNNKKILKADEFEKGSLALFRSLRPQQTLKQELGNLNQEILTLELKLAEKRARYNASAVLNSKISNLKNISETQKHHRKPAPVHQHAKKEKTNIGLHKKATPNDMIKTGIRSGLSFFNQPKLSAKVAKSAQKRQGLGFFDHASKGFFDHKKNTPQKDNTVIDFPRPR